MNNWRLLSVAVALAFRWDGRRTRLLFQTRADAYTAPGLLDFLRVPPLWGYRGSRFVR